MDLLSGAIRTYAWGSRTGIAELTGRPTPAPGPEAELWLGAHPGDPARLMTAEGPRSLLESLRADPERHLGPPVRARFGDELPFLVKVIAADQPLSLQVHPSAEQALAGYERENRMGVPVCAPTRNYRDPRHKPELVVALAPFHALAGFSPVARTRKLMRAMAITDLDPHDLLSNRVEPDGLRALFSEWMTAPAVDVDRMVALAVCGARRYLRSGVPEFAADAQSLLELGELYRGDAGVLAVLLLNRITLAPGDALFLPAGNLHAYLRGVAVEVMANSDNVLRGGLTPKHVDVHELLRVLDFTPVPEGQLRPRTCRNGPDSGKTAAVARFEITGTSERTVVDILREQSGNGQRKGSGVDVGMWLGTYLAGGPRWAATGNEDAAAAGFTEDKVKRARKTCNIESRKSGKHWYWATTQQRLLSQTPQDDAPEAADDADEEK